ADGAEDDEAVTVAQLKKVRGEVKESIGKSDLALSGVANAVAMANLPQVSGDRKFNLAASYGYYGGSHAVSVGFSGTNDKQNFTYKLSGAVNSKGNLALGIGAGVMIGSVDNKDKRIEELTNQVKELRKENIDTKENIKKQNMKIQKLEEIINKLMNK
ncbi:YadA-like family protein, partial [uncultured Sneathia sp.]|uniref:YadA-like family protein n=1 Tax=uncultured Sneathia sp. TaxID=278067 RepID=UPI002595C557